MRVDIYIDGDKIDLFKDESIEINSTVQNISDISKTFSDFSQSFTVPATKINNKKFQHYYDSDVDGTFNPNIRIYSHIEIGSLPFKTGVIQLEDVKLKNLKPYAYTIRFFSSVVNLSDRFGNDELSSLDLSEYDHDYNTDVLDATYYPTINEGKIYYPLITSVRNYEVGTLNENDITTTDGEIHYNELKPALRLISIFEAIESKYDIAFTRDFLNRALFGNLFMWMHKDAGFMESFGDSVYMDFPSNETEGPFTISASANTLSYVSDYKTINKVKVVPDAGFEGISYTISIENGLNELATGTFTGVNTLQFETTADGNNYVLKYKIKAVGDFDFHTEVRSRMYTPIASVAIAQDTSDQSLTGRVTISDVIPKMKVRDFVSSIIKMFNLVLVPKSQNVFQLLPLDDWYAMGRLIDITKYIDTTNITVKRPKLFKTLNFQHQQSDQILNKVFRENNGGVLGYGDLSATYDIDGTELKIETQFENLMFERLQDRETGDVSNIQVGKSVDLELQPYIGKPYIFYRSGYQFHEKPIKADGHSDLLFTWHTATENDVYAEQVTNSVNYSSDVSTFTFSEVDKNLFSNFWQDYVSDLYSTKRRLTSYEANFPVGVIISTNLNDRLVIDRKAYVINSQKSTITSGNVSLDLLNYIGLPFDSTADKIPITVDTTLYTADTTLLTADMTYIFIPLLSAIPNGIQYTSLLATSAYQEYDLKIDANQPYSVVKTNTGDGTSWISLENEVGLRTGYIKIKVALYTAGIASDSANRQMDITVTIGTDEFVLTITQQR